MVLVEDALALEVPTFDRNDLWVDEEADEEWRLARRAAVKWEQGEEVVACEELFLAEGGTAVRVLNILLSDEIEFVDRLLLNDKTVGLELFRTGSGCIALVRQTIPLDLAQYCGSLLLKRLPLVQRTEMFGTLDEAQTKVIGDERVSLRSLMTSSYEGPRDNVQTLPTPILVTGLIGSILSKCQMRGIPGRALISTQTAFSEVETAEALLEPMMKVFKVVGEDQRRRAFDSLKRETLQKYQPRPLFV